MKSKVIGVIVGALVTALGALSMWSERAFGVTKLSVSFFTMGVIVFLVNVFSLFVPVDVIEAWVRRRMEHKVVRVAMAVVVVAMALGVLYLLWYWTIGAPQRVSNNSCSVC